MVNTCSVIGCYNRSQRDKKSFYSIPSVVKHQGEKTQDLTSRRRALWLTRLNRPNFIPSRYTKICSDHFITGKPSTLYDTTNPDWAPSVGLKTYKKSKRGSKYSRRKTVESGSSSLSQTNVSSGNPQSQGASLLTSIDKTNAAKQYYIVRKINSFSQPPAIAGSNGLMRLEVSRHKEKSGIGAQVLNYQWNASTQTEFDSTDFACQFPPPERTSPADIDHSYVKRPFKDECVSSSCGESKEYSKEAIDDNNLPEIEIVLPIESEPELSQSPVGNSQSGEGTGLRDAEQNLGSRETADVGVKSESCLPKEDKGIYPVYLQSVAGEGWCL